MFELGNSTLLAAQRAGATYCDVRVVESCDERVATRNGKLVAIESDRGVGVGVRVLVDGAWGFAGVAGTDPAAAAEAARRAVEIGRASALLAQSPTLLAPMAPSVGEWDSPFSIDPFSVSPSERAERLLQADAVARRDAAIRVCGGHITARRSTVWLVSSEGTRTRQTFTSTGAGMSVAAVTGTDMQVRSWPAAFGGHWEQAGWEAVESLDFNQNAERIASEARALLAAELCPPGRRTVILEGSQLALQIHESCGHPSEVDRILDHEANFAGRTFLTRDKLGTFQYGSPIVNLVADSTQRGGLGTFSWDDEGVPAQAWDLVRDGVFVGYLTSRDTAAAAGDDTSRGCARACGWHRVPLVRMVNVSLEPGRAGTLEDLIADTEDGIYMETNSSWSIDDHRYNFQFGCELAWEIRNGRRERLLRNPIYGGITPTFWASCDAICSASEYRLWGVPNCGKGQPGQIIAMSHGAAPARFRDVEVGLRYAE